MGAGKKLAGKVAKKGAKKGATWGAPILWRWIKAYFKNVSFAGASMAASGIWREATLALFALLVVDSIWSYAHYPDATAPPIIGWWLFGLVALVYGGVERGPRRSWEEYVHEAVAEAVPGHTANNPPEISFGERGWFLGRVGRWTGTKTFVFEVPARMRIARQLEVEQHIREILATGYPSAMEPLLSAIRNYAPGFVRRLLLRLLDGGEEKKTRETWAMEWHPRERYAIARVVPDLPQAVVHPASEGRMGTPSRPLGDPTKIPLGIAVGARKIIWDCANLFGCLLVCGAPGGGKSGLLQAILQYLALHRRSFRTYLIDPKYVEFEYYRKHQRAGTIAGIETDLDGALELLQEIAEELERRKKLIGAARTQKLSEYNKILKSRGEKPLERIMVIMDEVADLVAPLTARDDEGKDANAKRNQVKGLTDKIVQLGRALGVHMVLATQRPDAEFISGRTKNNIGARAVMGGMDETGSLMALGSTIATTLPDEAGVGIWFERGKTTMFKAYLSEREDVDEMLEAA